MRDLGIWVICLGVVVAGYAAFIMSAGVDATATTEVYNLAKGQLREFAFEAGCTTSIAGVVLYGVGVIEEAVMRAGGFRRKKQPSSGQIEETPNNTTDDN